VGQECCKKKEKCVYNTIINSVTPYGCEVWKIKKKYSLWKWIFGADQQEHPEDRGLEIK
jgi:hypothetical protein